MRSAEESGAANTVANVVVTPTLRELFEAGWNKRRVFYFSAPCGMGKTTTARALLAGRTFLACSATVPNLESAAETDCEAVLIDDFQAIKDPADQQAICTLVNEHPHKRFLFLSRGVLPGWLMPYQFTDLLMTINVTDLLFDRATTQELAARYDVVLSDSDLSDLLKVTQGYPLLVNLLCRRMSTGEAYGGGVAE